MFRAYNKVTREWTSTVDGSELDADWIVDPAFADEAFAMQIGQKYWTFDENTILTPTPAEYAALVKAEQQVEAWLAIQEERTRRQNGGVYIPSISKWFHSDHTSRIQQLGLVMMGNNLPTGIQWKTMDGSFIEMTPAIALSIFNAAATLDMTAFAVAEQHRVNMMQAAEPLNYNYSGFWPAIYGG